MIIVTIGHGPQHRVAEALSTIHAATPITSVRMIVADDTVTDWARQHGIAAEPSRRYDDADLGVVFPGTEAAERWHARLLMDDIPCLEIH